MKKQTEKTPLARLWHAVVGELRLHGDDVWQLALVPLGAAVFLGAILAGAMLWAEDTSAPEVVGVVMSTGIVVVGVGCGLLISGTLFTVYYKLGIQMGQTRRNMLLRLSLLSLAEQLGLLAFSVGLSGVITLVYRRFFSETEWIFGFVPWWGWVLMLTLPLAVGTFGGAVILRFGRKGFWVLYGMFMAVMLLPQLFTDAYVNQIGMTVEWVMELTLQMPQLICAVSLLPYLVGVALLWHLPIRD